MKRIKQKGEKIKLDKTGIVLLCCVVFLSLFGILMVYSASFYSANRTYNNPYFFLTKQTIGFVIGSISLILMSRINYNKLQKISSIIFFVSIVLLALVFVPGLGVENYGARRWLRLPGFTIQPSEIAKFSFVLFSATYLSKNSNKVKTFKGILPVILSGGLLCLLIILEPNMSITICVGLVVFTMLFIGGLRLKHFLWILIPALCLVPILIIIEPYRLARLMAFINPWANPKGEGYQLIQSFFSISSGGLFGVGLFNSRQKYLFLPFAESDFIFSVIAEEFGLVGSIVILFVYFIVVICGIKIAIRAKNRFGSYLATGITAVIAVQTLLNIAVVSGSIPPTGLPLPFISSGSTSLVVFLSAIGILLNINCQSQCPEVNNTSKFSFNYLKKKTI